MINPFALFLAAGLLATAAFVSPWFLVAYWVWFILASTKVLP